VAGERHTPPSRLAHFAAGVQPHWQLRSLHVQLSFGQPQEQELQPHPQAFFGVVLVVFVIFVSPSATPCALHSG